MVEVIGVDQAQFLEVTCKNCASKLRYTRNEVHEGTHYDYGGGSDTVYWIDCPSCGQKVYVRYK